MDYMDWIRAYDAARAGVPDTFATGGKWDAWFDGVTPEDMAAINADRLGAPLFVVVAEADSTGYRVLSPDGRIVIRRETLTVCNAVAYDANGRPSATALLQHVA